MTRPPLVPEIVDDGPLPADILALQRLARLLDQAVAVPGTTRRVGLDPLLGLLPGIGDFVSSGLALVIVHGALRHRVPSRKVWRMLANVLLDGVVGTVPVFGDIIDALYTSNVKNAELLVKHRDATRPPRSGREVAGVLALAALATLIAVGLAVFGVALALAWLFRQIF